MRTLIRGAQVLTLDPGRPVISDGAVLVEGDRIVAVDTCEALRQSPGIEQEWGTDDTWVLPGFVNAHYHHDRVFSMGLPDAPLELWLLRGSGLEAPAPEVEDEFNYLNTLVSAIHGVWYSDRDIEVLAAHGVVTVHNPSSNLRLASGIAPVAAYLDAGMTVALGTDGQGLTERSNFLDEMRLAAYLQRIPSAVFPPRDRWSRGLPARTVFEMATVNGARAFRREGIGRLQAGYRADLLLLNAKRLRTPFLWPGHDPYATVLQKAELDHLDMVISRGRVLLDGGRIVTVDEARVTQKLQSLYATIWKKQDGQRQALVRELEPYFFRFFQSWQELPTPARW